MKLHIDIDCFFIS